MVRGARIDYPGALHHVMMRGIERRRLFKDDTDREEFMDRLSGLVETTQTICYAFALMPNHVHLLLQTGGTSVTTILQRLLTGYARYFNLRHRRSGRLFQDRFKSILCDKETYFLELVRYIHLNPLRGRLVKDLTALDRHPWTGHGIIMGRREGAWLQSEELLSQFGREHQNARQAYRAFVSAGIAEGSREDLRGGGLIRSLGGRREMRKAARKGKRQLGDERILGDSDFAAKVLKHSRTQRSKRKTLQIKGRTFKRVLQQAAAAVELEPEDLRQRGKGARSKGRALLCKWLVDDLQIRASQVAHELALTRGAMTTLVRRGRVLEKEMEVSLRGA